MLEKLAKIADFLPSIKPPSRQLLMKEKLFYTIFVVLVYFFLLHATVIGVVDVAGQFDFVQMITASRLGSLLTLGIGPIVIASIALQLLIGGGVINLDLRNPKDKETFHKLQRVFTILIALIEAYVFVGAVERSNLISPTINLYFDNLRTNIPDSLSFLSMLLDVRNLIAIQFFIGALIVVYLDEIITKYGIGSGIGVFIAQGVSYSAFAGAVRIIFGENGIISQLASASATSISLALIKSIPIITTTVVFLALVFFEGVKINVPISIGSLRGVRRSIPFPLFYVSNIPVIFAAALLLNVVFISNTLITLSLEMEQKGEQGVVKDIVKFLAELTYLMTPITILNPGDFNAYLNNLMNGTTPVYGLPQWVHALFYIITISLLSIFFGVLWVEIAGMDAKSIADLLYRQGISMPGFRMNKRLLEMELNKYIFPLTVLGSLSVGLLAGLADLFGILGTGTGILLTVNILHRMEPQVREGVEMFFPKLAKFLFG